MPVLRQQRLQGRAEGQEQGGLRACSQRGEPEELAQSWALWDEPGQWGHCLEKVPEVSPRPEEKHFEVRWRFLASFWRLPLGAAGHSELGFNPLLIRVVFLPLR